MRESKRDDSQEWREEVKKAERLKKALELVAPQKDMSRTNQLRYQIGYPLPLPRSAKVWEGL